MTEVSTTTVRGAELAHHLSGDGPDVVWGHGLTSSMAGEDMFPLLDWPALRRRHRVLRYDARGHGQSASTDDPDAYSWDQLALDQFALADALGIGRYLAGGASMGCATALHAAVLDPDRVRALVLVIPPTAWETRAAQASTYVASAELVENGQPDVLIAGSRALPPPDPFIGEPAWKQRFADMVEATDPIRLARVFRGAARADLPPPDAIARIRVPTLVLAWTGDAGHPTSTAARLQELIPGAELALATTMVGLAAWTERVGRFLSSVEA